MRRLMCIASVLSLLAVSALTTGRARAVNAEQLGTYLAAVPTAMFGGTGPTSVSLDPDTTFPS